MVLPRSLFPFKKEKSNLLRLEKAKFMQNKRFSKIFTEIDMQPVFANRENLKKLVVRTKVVEKEARINECEKLPQTLRTLGRRLIISLKFRE